VKDKDESCKFMHYNMSDGCYDDVPVRTLVMYDVSRICPIPHSGLARLGFPFERLTCVDRSAVCPSLNFPMTACKVDISVDTPSDSSTLSFPAHLTALHPPTVGYRHLARPYPSDSRD
jgi:hypothetical protein